MDTAQRASDIVASPSTSDRGAFRLLPALGSAQFSDIVDTHRRAKLGRPAPIRPPATPCTANEGAAPVLNRRLPPIMPRIPSLSLLDPADPVPLRPNALSTTDTFSGDARTRLRSRPAEDSYLSDVDDGVGSDDLTPELFTPPASVGGARSVPTTTAATAVGRPSAFLSHAHGDPAPAAGSHRRVRADSGSESHFPHSPHDTAPNADSHRGICTDDDPESRLLRTGDESEPHLSHTHHELAPHLSHPRHDPVPTADSHRGARADGTSGSHLLHTRYDLAFALAAAAARPPSAVFLRARDGPATDAGFHREARTGGTLGSHLSTTPRLTTADPSATATSAATTLVASPISDATGGSADHFSAPAHIAATDITATDAPTTETPTIPPPPPFYVSEGAKDGALAASSSPCDPAPAAGSHQRVHDGGRPELHLSHSPYETAPAADSHNGARANDEFEPHLLQASGESEPHLSHTHYELAPHLLHPRHDPALTADSHRGARAGGTSGSASVGETAAAVTPSAVPRAIPGEEEAARAPSLAPSET